MIRNLFSFFQTLLGYKQASSDGIDSDAIAFCKEDRSIHTHYTDFYCGSQKLGTAAYQSRDVFSAAGHTHQYLPLSGGTMTDTINSSVKTNTHLAGNKGRVIINSTASAGSYVMLAKMNSTNGFFTHGTLGTDYKLQYTAASVVSEGKNYVSYTAKLLDEGGNTSFPGTVTAPTFSGKLNGNANTASKWAKARTITIGNTGKSVNGSSNVAWSLSEIGAAPTNHTHEYLPLSGGTVNGDTTITGTLSNGDGISTDGGLIVGGSSSFEGTATFDSNAVMNASITSSVNTHTHIAGNQGSTIINSTAKPGSYVMLAKMNSTNGVFTHGTFGTDYRLQYTAASVVSEGKNEITHTAYLLKEDGNTHFPGTVTAPTFSGNLNGNANTASKWQTSRTIAIGNTGKSVDGSRNVAWSLSEIGAAPASHTHPYLPTSGGAITGNLGVQGDLNVLGDVTFNEGILYAPSIIGNLDGTASKALGDGQGQQINTTYIKGIDFRGLPFTITKGDGSTYSQKAGYLYENTDTKDWVHLGTFNTNIQGDGGEIWLFGGAGQNGDPGQHMWAHLFIKQGFQATESTTGRYAATYEIFCDNKGVYSYAHLGTKFKVFCKEIGKVDVWAYFGHDYSRCYYYPAGRYDSFVPSNELLSSEPTDESIYGVEQPISGGFVIPSKKGYGVDDMLPLTGGTINGDLAIQGTGNLRVQGDLNVLGDVTFSEGILYTDEIKGFSENHKTLILGTRDNSGYIYLTDDIRGAEWSVISGKFICANVTANGFIHSNPVNNANDILLANGSTLAQSTFSSSGHTHDDRYYTESEIDTKLNAKSNTDHTHNYLPLSGGFMTGNIWYTGLGTSYIGLGRNDGANEVGGELNNIVISSWYGVSFTTSCGGQKYSGTNAVSIDCRNGIVYAEKFIGSLQGNAATATKASSADSVSWSNVTGKPVAYQPVSHNHDDRYYTESEIDTKLNAKSNTDHTHAYLSLTGGKVTGDLGVSGELLTKRIESPTDNSILLGSGTNAGYIAMSDDLVGNSNPTNAGSNWCIEFGGDAFFSSVSQTSDQRLKENIHDVSTEFLEKYWDTENGLIHEYDWKKSGKHATGMIAQELLNYIPESVKYNQKDDSYSVDYTIATCKIIGAMFKKIKELEETIHALEER